MVTSEELQDDEEYQDIVEDITEECNKFGEVEGVRIPRPVARKQKKGWAPETMSAVEADQNRRMDEANGVGRVYVMFTSVDAAKKAMEALGGRQFGGRTILVASVSEDEFVGEKPPPLPALPAPPVDDSAAPPPASAPAPAAPKPTFVPQPPPPKPKNLDEEADDLLNDILG